MIRSAKVMIWIGLAAVCLPTFLGGISYSASDIPAFRDIKEPGERARVQALIEGARTEGKLVWATNKIYADMSTYVFEGFKTYYGLPNLVQEFTNVGSGVIVTQVEQLLQARRPTHDILWFGSWAWYKDLLARGHIMRYDSPMYKDYTISHKAGSSEPGYWVSDSYTFHPMYNRAALAKAGIKDFNPTSYQDFVDPRFQKLISISNFPQTQTDSLVGMGWRKVVGDEWFKKMAKLKPALFVRQAQARDWVVSGEYPICMTSNAVHAVTAKKAGVPVKLLYPKEGVVLLPFAPIIMAVAPHPHVAKLFIDYVRSIPGTNRMAESGASLFYGRPGVKIMPEEKEFLPASENLKIIPMDWNAEGTPEAVNKFQQWILDIGLSY